MPRPAAQASPVAFRVPYANSRQARTSCASKSGSSSTIASCDSPAPSKSSTSATRMRIPRMHGRPPHRCGFGVTRVEVSMCAVWRKLPGGSMPWNLIHSHMRLPGASRATSHLSAARNTSAYHSRSRHRLLELDQFSNRRGAGKVAADEGGCAVALLGGDQAGRKGGMWRAAYGMPLGGPPSAGRPPPRQARHRPLERRGGGCLHEPRLSARRPPRFHQRPLQDGIHRTQRAAPWTRRRTAALRFEYPSFALGNRAVNDRRESLAAFLEKRKPMYIGTRTGKASLRQLRPTAAPDSPAHAKQSARSQTLASCAEAKPTEIPISQYRDAQDPTRSPPAPCTIRCASEYRPY